MFNMFCVFVKEHFWQSGVRVNDSVPFGKDAHMHSRAKIHHAAVCHREVRQIELSLLFCHTRQKTQM